MKEETQQKLYGLTDARIRAQASHPAIYGFSYKLGRGLVWALLLLGSWKLYELILWGLA